MINRYRKQNQFFFIAILDVVQLIPPKTMSNNTRVNIMQTIRRPSVNYKFNLHQTLYRLYVRIDQPVFCHRAELLALERGHCIRQMARKTMVGRSPASGKRKCTFEDG